MNARCYEIALFSGCILRLAEKKKHLFVYFYRLQRFPLSLPPPFSGATAKALATRWRHSYHGRSRSNILRNLFGAADVPVCGNKTRSFDGIFVCYRDNSDNN